MNETHFSVQHYQITNQGIKKAHNNVAVESPVTLWVNGETLLTFQCTPVDIEALGIGFLYTEGFINSVDQIENINLCAQNKEIDVWLDHPINKPESRVRSTDCFDGLSSTHTNLSQSEPHYPEFSMKPSEIYGLIEQFLRLQLPRTTYGGVHTTAIADGKIIMLEVIDIGRHNSLDKIAGRILLNKIGINNPVLITTGRISSDMVHKSIKLHSPFIISLRSVSQEAVSLADRYGITLICGASRSRFNVYSHPERIITG